MIDMMNSKIYDIMKFVAQIVLPAIATLYAALAGIWGLPYGDQIVGTIVAIDTFLGALLMIDNASYKKNIMAAEDSLGDSKGEE